MTFMWQIIKTSCNSNNKIIIFYYTSNKNSISKSCGCLLHTWANERTHFIRALNSALVDYRPLTALIAHYTNNSKSFKDKYFKYMLLFCMIIFRTLIIFPKGPCILKQILLLKNIHFHRSAFNLNFDLWRSRKQKVQRKKEFVFWKHALAKRAINNRPYKANNAPTEEYLLND